MKFKSLQIAYIWGINWLEISNLVTAVIMDQELDPEVLQRLGLLEIQLEELRTALRNARAAHGLLDILPQEEGAA